MKERDDRATEEIPLSQIRSQLRDAQGLLALQRRLRAATPPGRATFYPNTRAHVHDWIALIRPMGETADEFFSIAATVVSELNDDESNVHTCQLDFDFGNIWTDLMQRRSLSRFIQKWKRRSYVVRPRGFVKRLGANYDGLTNARPRQQRHYARGIRSLGKGRRRRCGAHYGRYPQGGVGVAVNMRRCPKNDRFRARCRQECRHRSAGTASTSRKPAWAKAMPR